MNDKNKDGLEEFFRKGTQNYQFEFREADWEKLEKKLDQSDKALVYRKLNYRRGLIIAAALLVASMAVYFSLDFGKGKQNRVGLNTESTVSHPNSMKEDPSSNKILSDTRSIREASGIDEKTFSDQEESANVARNPVLDNKETTDQHKISNSGQNGIISSDQLAHTSGHKHLKTVESQPSSAALIRNAEKTTTGRDEMEALGIPDISRQEVHFLVPRWRGQDLEFSGFRTITGIQSFNLAAKNVDLADLMPKDNLWANRPFWGIGVTVAPDFSSVGLFDYTPPGKRVGLVISYFIARRFEIGAGLIMTDNKYSAQGDEYTPPKGFWTNGAIPDQATGKCKILDIPVNIRYNVGMWDKHQVFINAGISSYFMLEEHYWFSYENGYSDPNAVKYWGGKNTTQHIMGLLNLSVGYEFSPTPKLGVSVEPFIKIPVTGIGYGKVDLYTIGGYFTLRYKMFRAAKNHIY